MSGLFDRPGLRYISHRGFRPLAPDNSIPGFEYAGILRQWAIETDVHFTKDGIPVCCHNDTVDATFDGTGAIRDMTWAELSKLRMNTGNRLACLTDEQKRMPLFSEYLLICKRYGCIPFIELKTDNAEQIVRHIRNTGFDDNEVIMSSTALHRLAETRKHSQSMFIHWIFAQEDQLDTLRNLDNAGLSWNIPNVFDCPEEKISMVHNMGLKVCLRAGDTVESVTQMQKLGLDYIPSNCMHE